MGLREQNGGRECCDGACGIDGASRHGPRMVNYVLHSAQNHSGSRSRLSVRGSVHNYG